MDIRPGVNQNKAFHPKYSPLRGPRVTAVVYNRPHAASRPSMQDIKVPVQVKTTPKPQLMPLTLSQGSAASIKVQPYAVKPAPVFLQLKPLPIQPKQSRSGVLKRQAVKGESKKSHSHKHRRPLVPTLLTAMAIMLFTFGLLVLFSTLKTNHTVKAQVKQLSQNSSKDDGITDEAPSEEDPPANPGNYEVAADLPRLITIDKIGVRARVRRLGVGANNVLKAPANIFDAGWYDSSAKPGENGTVVLDGHVSGPTKHGVFYSIGTLKAGDKVKLERGDGQVLSYTVTGTQVYDNDKVDMAKVLTTAVPGKPGLNFMTCTGRFNVRSNSFEQRVVVFSVQDQ